jgi:hypothetical protein
MYLNRSIYFMAIATAHFLIEKAPNGSLSLLLEEEEEEDALPSFSAKTKLVNKGPKNHGCMSAGRIGQIQNTRANALAGAEAAPIPSPGVPSMPLDIPVPIMPAPIMPAPMPC